MSFCSFTSVVSAAPKDAPAALGWDKGKQGQFVMALLEDQRGDVWVATEDKGIWRYTVAPNQKPIAGIAANPNSNAKPEPNAKPVAPPKIWVNYSLKEGLGDDTVYALAEDRKGRIWAGTLRNGVSVWNGKQWQNYGLLDGPLGERVFAIATCPTDGDVWMATNAGLARYSLKKDTWSYFTRAEGLPSDQIQAIAFDSLGNLYAGSQCDGLALGIAGDDYKTWKITKGPERMTDSLQGAGLPSNQINDILVADNDTVYVATTSGLARSHDFGSSWSYMRGYDWVDKVKNQRHKPTPKPRPDDYKKEILREDYVTNLGEDERGLLYIGYRVKGYEIRRPLTDRVELRSDQEANDSFPYVGVVLPMRDGRILLANYGTGLTLADEPPPFIPTAEEKKEMGFRRNWKRFDPPAAPVALPVAAAAPSEADLKALLTKINTPSASLQTGEGYYESEDWRTWGDWVGRYGSRYAVLCAAGAPLNHYVVNDLSYSVKGYMGPGFKGNSLRHWIHWLKNDNPRILYNPLLGYRREAEWDDNGEVMSMSIEGPDVWAKVTVPAGTHRLSSYYFNKDGHSGNNRLRDYMLELKKGEAKTVEEAEKLPTQAQTRIRDFWGGVYKRFVVQGPGTFWLKVGKNNSFNTILCGVFLDKLDGPPTKFEGSRSPFLGEVRYELPEQKLNQQSDALNALPDKIAQDAGIVWLSLDTKYPLRDVANTQWAARVLALRATGSAGWGNFKPSVKQVAKGSKPVYQALLKQWRWQSAIWTEADRIEFQESMLQAHESLIKLNPDLKRTTH